MGSLTAAGIAGGIGGGLKNIATSKAATRMQDDQQAHDLQVQNQRDTAARNRATTLSEHQLGMAKTRGEHELGMAETESEASLKAADLLYGRQQGMQEKLLGSQEKRAGAEMESLEKRATQTNQTRIDVAMIQAYTAQTKSGRVSVDGWDIKTSDEQVMDPDSPSGFSIIPIIRASYQGKTWRQVEDKMFAAGGSTTPKTTFPSIDAQREVENALYSGEVDSQTFNDVHGYLPTDYVTGLALKAPSVVEWIKTNRMPVLGADLPDTVAPMGGEKPSASEVDPQSNLTQGQGLFPPYPGGGGRGPVNAQGIPIVQTDQRNTAQKLLTVMQ